MKETNAEGGFVSAVINYVLRVKHTFIFRNKKWRESSQLLVEKKPVINLLKALYHFLITLT